MRNPKTMVRYGMPTASAMQRHGMSLAGGCGADRGVSCSGTKVFDDVLHQFSCEMRNKVEEEFRESSVPDAAGCCSDVDEGHGQLPVPKTCPPIH